MKGCDPEFFVFEGDKPIPSTKYFEHECDFNEIHHDGFQAELKVKPSKSTEKLLKHIKETLEAGYKVVSQKVVNPENITFRAISTIKSDRKTLDSGGDAVLEFGCAPHFSVYNEKAKYPDGRTHLYRYSGGHIHLECNDKDRIPLIIKLDLFLTTALNSLDMESYKRRLKYYGRAGIYRFTDYGIEYRTPSSFWLKSPKLTRFAFKLADYIRNMDNNIIYSFNIDEVRKMINSDNKEAMYKFWLENIGDKNLIEEYKDLMNMEFNDDLLVEWGVRNENHSL